MKMFKKVVSLFVLFIAASAGAGCAMSGGANFSVSAVRRPQVTVVQACHQPVREVCYEQVECAPVYVERRATTYEWTVFEARMGNQRENVRYGNYPVDVPHYSRGSYQRNVRYGNFPVDRPHPVNPCPQR